MGKNTTSGPDKARAVVSGSFTADGSSAAVELHRQFNVWVAAGLSVSRVVLERSYDAGDTWFDAAGQVYGTADDVVRYGDRSNVLFEPEQGILYRLTCFGWDGITIPYRLSQ